MRKLYASKLVFSVVLSHTVQSSLRYAAHSCSAAGKIIKALGRKENRNGAISSTRVGSDSPSVLSLPSGIQKRLLDLGEESGFNALQMKFQGPEESSVYAPATGFEACVMLSTKWKVNEEKCTARQLGSQPLGMGFGDDKNEALFE